MISVSPEPLKLRAFLFPQKNFGIDFDLAYNHFRHMSETE